LSPENPEHQRQRGEGVGSRASTEGETRLFYLELEWAKTAPRTFHDGKDCLQTEWSVMAVETPNEVKTGLC